MHIRKGSRTTCNATKAFDRRTLCSYQREIKLNLLTALLILFNEKAMRVFLGRLQLEPLQISFASDYRRGFEAGGLRQTVHWLLGIGVPLVINPRDSMLVIARYRQQGRPA